MNSKLLITSPTSRHFTGTETGSEMDWLVQSHKGRKGWGWDLHLGLTDPNPGLLLLKSDLPPKEERVLLEPNSSGLFLILFLFVFSQQNVFTGPLLWRRG